MPNDDALWLVIHPSAYTQRPHHWALYFQDLCGVRASGGYRAKAEDSKGMFFCGLRLVSKGSLIPVVFS